MAALPQPHVAAARRDLAVGGGLALAALLILGTALAGPPRDAVPAWLASLGLTGLALAIAGRRLGATGRPAAWILGGALVLRLAALAAPVSLSDDVHRYVWDGALVAQGEDPYAARPSAIVGEHGLDAAALRRLNSPDYFSVYPPLAQLAFAVGGLAHLGGADGARVLRALLVGAELVGVWALLGLLRRLDRPPGWALLYAWNPVVVWEVAGGGHTEALMLPFLLLAVTAALDDRALRAGALLGLAASAKLTALLAGPLLLVFLLRRLGPRRALGFALGAATLAAVGWLPFARPETLAHVGESLALYRETFSFNAPVYYGLRWLLGYREGLTPPVDAALMPWLTGATLLGLGALAFAQDGGARRLVAGLGWAFALYLVLSRVIHPWYLLPVLAFGAAARRPALLVLGTLAALSYLRYHPLGVEAPWVLAVQAVPFAALALTELALASPTTVTNPTCPEPPSRVDYAPCRSRSST